MQAPETIVALEGFKGRGPGTDAERRAARWLADELAGEGRNVWIETFWCRPNWALTHAWHLLLAIAGSLVSVASPRVGGSLLLAALVFVIADALTGVSPGRRLTPERASQNVVAVLNPKSRKRVRLILTANYDAGRTGLSYRDGIRGVAAALHRATGGITPGWLGWICIALAWLLGTAIARLEGHTSTLVSALQVLPTLALVLALALLAELASSKWSPAAGDNASGVAAALALARALDAAPPAHLKVEVVLQGAGDGGEIGMRRYLRARRRELKPSNAVVLGVAPCGAGGLRWWSSDGPLLPRRYWPLLRKLCARIAREETDMGARVHHGRGATPSLPARAAHLPAIALGSLDERGLAPRSHQRGDVAAAIDPAALDAVVQFGLMLVDSIDAAISARRRRRATPTPA